MNWHGFILFCETLRVSPTSAYSLLMEHFAKSKVSKMKVGFLNELLVKSLLNKIDSLEGKLLIIHGAMDPTVVWQNSLQFLKVAIDKDKDIDYFVYPGHGHNVHGMNRSHLYKKITSFFNDYLK